MPRLSAPRSRWVPAIVVASILTLYTGAGTPFAAVTHPHAAAHASRTGLRPGLQLAAMRTTIAAAPQFFPGFHSGCARTTPVLAWSSGPALAGNFRDDSGGCYVWLNLANSAALTVGEICKTSLHEIAHQTGLANSPDPANVMHSPFFGRPLAAPCSHQRDP